ncbi:FAD-dependent oxidoreductase [Rhodobacter capsulatus]|uniref:FAD-dependent oxidoreductase n=1 Tax=Rhodobacter capsulatus TaxID=1061 RepID=A0A4U1JRI0_RHOCA|nr:FAD/NAD(P)-binding protein [Rhodobacter capsulatus]TKD21711.1 FAD-dependent oxidoreductase [Rhodobacter capsulatus]
MTAQPPSRRHVLVIGGGASGVLMAYHLLRAAPETRVTLIERSPRIGLGLAYATDDPDHLLNTRVINMSALPEDPEHFLRWLWQANRTVSGASFVSRATYGRYLESLLAPWAAGPRLRLVQAEAVRLTEAPPGRVTLTLDDRQTLIADHAILATGHPQPRAVRGLQADVTQLRLDPDVPVAILGTGLSMVDQVTTLLKSGHHGPIIALSRRGLLPRVHAPGTPLATSLGEVPLGAPASVLLHWLRRQVRRAEIAGGSWRDAIDGLRPHVQGIWTALPGPERARALRHAAAWWEVHRHRMPPETASRIAEARASGQLQILRGAFDRVTPHKCGVWLQYRPCRHTGTAALNVAAVIDCRGVRRDPEIGAGPLLRHLLDDGLAQIDPLRLGLVTDRSGRLVTLAGKTSQVLQAIGPAARAALWEITAIPDIRTQTARIAAELSQVPAPS